MPIFLFRIIPGQAAPGLAELKWRVLRDFARMRHEMGDGVLMVGHGYGAGPAIAPVMEELRLLFGALLVPSAGGNFRAQPCVKIAVRFSNPHSVPLKWERPLELEFFNVTHPKRIPTRHPSESTPGAGAMLPRSPGQLCMADAGEDGIGEASLAGFRRLSEKQIHTLAEEIVRQVRLRGPFASVSHFVNRALVPLADHPEPGRSGALQSAIDRSGINEGALFDAESGRIRLRADASGTPAADVPGPNPTRWPDSPPDGVWPKFSLDTNPGSLAGIFADREVLTDEKLHAEQGHRCTGMPGWLTQADVLQVIGPALTARSDTFRIRACGESSRKVGGKPVRVFCEAIVQRMPGYLDAANPPDAAHADLVPVNQSLGRRFHILSFRWLPDGEM